MKTLIAPLPLPVADEARRPGRRLLMRWRAWMRRRRDARVLAAFGDRMLDDVGLTRSDLHAPARGHLSPRWWE